MHSDGAGLLVNGGDEFVGGWNQVTVFKTEKNIEGRIVDRGDTTYFVPAFCFDNVKPYNGNPRDAVAIAVSKFAGEIDLAARKLFGTLLGVDVFKFYNGIGIAAETVFFDEEGYEDTIDLQD